MLKTTKPALLIIAIFAVFSVWWLIENVLRISNPELESTFAHLYWILPAVGSILGYSVSKYWGGFKSVMGKSIAFFALGLFAQTFGQFTYSAYFFVLHQDVPYPSIGDIGFFGSIPLYILGVWYLSKASGVKIGLKSFTSKLQAILIPLLMLGIVYFLFLQDYELDFSNPLAVILDFGYPLGQALYISLAILTYSLSRGILGGLMKNKVLFLLFALVVQFAADFTFLFQAARGTWYPGGINDFLYLLSYFLMSLSLIQLKTVSDSLKAGK